MSNNISINFAKWFINKNRSSGIFVDSNVFDFIIAQLDNSSWDEFIAANSENVDALIPQLVQKMPKKPRAPKKVADDAKPKGKKTRIDAQTSTGDDATEVTSQIITEVVAPVQEEKKEKKEVKKCAPKAKKIVDTVALEQPEVPEAVTVEQEVVKAEKPEVVVKEVKKRAPKAKKIAEEVQTEQTEGDVVAVNEPTEINEPEVKEPKEIKKRAPKAKKIAEVQEVAVVDKEPKKKRGPKKTKTLEENRAPDEVIVPVQEQSVLSEEPYQEQEEETVLTEVFVNDVLFYVDSDGNWFDSNLQSTVPQN
jgi:hypothetical protein